MRYLAQVPTKAPRDAKKCKAINFLKHLETSILVSSLLVLVHIKLIWRPFFRTGIQSVNKSGSLSIKTEFQAQETTDKFR